MSNAFTNFLSSVGSGLVGNTDASMKDYKHASYLYTTNNYARAPKFGHLYFVAFNFNDGVIRDAAWAQLGFRDVGLLVKSITLPKFKISTEVLNQYNRKTVVQTKLNYETVSMEFHDDNSEITNGLWKNYYKYYYTDSTYGGAPDNISTPAKKSSIVKNLFGGVAAFGSKRIKNNTSIDSIPEGYVDTKYSEKSYSYGFDGVHEKPFFRSIDIYILHQQKFTQITLVNPKITEWSHDELSQSESAKLLRNKMSVAYEDVFYNQGSIGKGSNSGVFASAYYDNSASPLSIGGKGSKSLLGPGGLVGGISSIFGENGSLAQGNLLAAALQSATLLRNAKSITKESYTAAGYSILGTSLGLAITGAGQPGGAAGAVTSGLAQTGLGIYTNQYATSNLEEKIVATPVTTQPKK
jgi:hypothetical protein